MVIAVESPPRDRASGNQVLGFERQHSTVLQPLHAQMHQTALLTKQLALSSQESSRLREQLDAAHRNLESAQRELNRQRSRWPARRTISARARVCVCVCARACVRVLVCVCVCVCVTDVPTERRHRGLNSASDGDSCMPFPTPQ